MRRAGVFAIFGLLIACSEGDGLLEAATATTAEADRAAFTLVVSNQSFENPTVFVSVTIDGERVIAQPFDVEGQHSFVQFPLDVPAGDHVLSAVANDGTSIESPFTLPADTARYGVLFYWAEQGGRPFFDLAFQEDPPGFG